MANFSLENFQAQKAILQSRFDALGVVVEEANTEKTKIQEQITELDRYITYAQGGFVPVIGKLLPVADFTGVSINASTARLTWSAVAGATGYVIVYSLQPGFSDVQDLVVLPLLTYDHENLQTGVTYFYRIYAYAEGAGNSDTVDTSVLISPGLEAADNFQVVGQSGQIAISWDAVANALSYLLYRGVNPNFTDAALLMTVYDTNWTDDTVVIGTLYYYWLIPAAPLYENGPAVTGDATATV